MSTNLYWNPVINDDNCITNIDLKHALRKCSAYCHVDITLDNEDLPYLRGLRDAGIESAQELIDAIEENGPIKVEERS
jgi:hypothetical protein